MVEPVAVTEAVNVTSPSDVREHFRPGTNEGFAKDLVDLPDDEDHVSEKRVDDFVVEGGGVVEAIGNCMWARFKGQALTW